MSWDVLNYYVECGSPEGNLDFDQVVDWCSNRCRDKEKELAELKDKHEKLVNAASRIAALAIPVKGRPAYWIASLTVDELRKTLESEAKK